MKRIFFTLLLGLLTTLFIWHSCPAASRSSLTSFTPDSTIKSTPTPTAEKGSKPVLKTGTLLSPPRLLPPFSLTDTHNQHFTDTSLQGQWTLMFFGYARCPAICPATLAIVGELWRSFPKPDPTQPIQFVFVSLDEADTPTTLGNFLARFHPTFIGLTGHSTAINALAKACRIYSWTDTTSNATGQKVIDHSATLLLINPEGRIQAVFSPPHITHNIAHDIELLMKA